MLIIFTSFGGMEGIFWRYFLNLGRESRGVEDLSLLVDSGHGIPAIIFNFCDFQLTIY